MISPLINLANLKPILRRRRGPDALKHGRHVRHVRPAPPLPGAAPCLPPVSPPSDVRVGGDSHLGRGRRIRDTRREAKQQHHQRRAVQQGTPPPHPRILCFIHPPDPRRLRPSPVRGGTSSSRSASGTTTPNDATRSARVRTTSRMAALDEIAVSVKKKALDHWGGSEERKGWGCGGGQQDSSGSIIVSTRQKLRE